MALSDYELVQVVGCGSSLPLRPDERMDQVETQGIIDALNNYVPDGGQQQVSAPFTNDADNQLAPLSSLDRRLVPANTPWSEVKPFPKGLAPCPAMTKTIPVPDKLIRNQESKVN